MIINKIIDQQKTAIVDLADDEIDPEELEIS